MPQVRKYTAEETEQIQYHSGLPDCRFLEVEVEGKASADDTQQALTVSNDKKPIKVSVKFYVPTHILNLRATGKHQL